MGMHPLMTWSGGDLHGGEQVAQTSAYPTEAQPNRSTWDDRNPCCHIRSQYCGYAISSDLDQG